MDASTPSPTLDRATNGSMDERDADSRASGAPWTVARRVAELERSGGSERRASAAATALERVAEDVRSARMRLFDGGGGSPTTDLVADSTVISMRGTAADATVRVERVIRRARSEVQAVNAARMERAEGALMRWREALVAPRRVPGPVRRAPGAKRRRDESDVWLARAALEAWRLRAETRRALLRAASDMATIRRAPVMRVAFDVLRANAAANAPRSRALVETCERFVSVSTRRMRRACLRAWRDAVRECTLEKTCAAIHNVRCVHAALRHWELFVARAFWKRTANELALRYARGRLRVRVFCAWLLHLRRAKERRIAVRARMFGMSVPEAQRAVHDKLDRTARDATLMAEKELVFLFEEHCLRSALRSQVAAGAKLVRTLADLRRFSADESDVDWASSDAAALHGVGSARRHIDAGFSTRGTKPISSVRRAALSRDREDVAVSRAVAAIEDEDEATSMDDGALMEAEAFERAREHEAALSAAREATKRCMDARKFAQEVSLRANRLLVSSDSRANAACQGAQDAMDESARAECLAMEAEVEADAAEERANALSKTLGAENPEVSEAFRRAADAATRAVTLSLAHVAAARVAERALDIAEEHKRAADLIKAQASDDVEAARSRVLEAEATLMATAKAERELKMELMRATASFRHATSDAPPNVRPYEERMSNAVFSPTKRRSAEEKQIARRRLTWASFGDDDDIDDVMQLRGVSLIPGKWVTLAECATQAYAKRLAFKSLRGFNLNVDWRRRQREAALLALVTKAFTTWAELSRVNQSRRRLVESVVDEVLGEDRTRRMHVYMIVLQKHAKWRRARCEELRVSLRRVITPTVLRPAFDHWRAKVGRILLVRRVINRGIAAWKVRGNRPSHANAFYRMYDAFAAWRTLARVKREQRRRTAAAREYHRVAVALRVIQEWRRASRRGRARARDLEVDLEEFRIRRRLQAKRSAFARWRAETLRRQIRALSLEHSHQTLSSRALDAWRAVTIASPRLRRRQSSSSRVQFAL